MGQGTGGRGVRVGVCLLALCLLVQLGLMAQAQVPLGQQGFTQEELDGMLAPIALYPDGLLSQILMAATYPLEVVAAARWVQANPSLGGDQLAAALEQEDWDASVKSLINFSEILWMMNDNLEWVQRLGDAFLGQEEQVMDTVQNLRQRARAQGALVTTGQEQVLTEPQSQDIIIEPAVPDVVYVPLYDPMIVYGPWWWPAHPPYRIHPRRLGISGGFIDFGLGVAWGYAWGGFDWRRHEVVINMGRNAAINPHIDRGRYAGYGAGGGGPAVWTHEPTHRRGVAYRTPSVAQHFGRGISPGAEARRDFRGFGGGSGTDLAQAPRASVVGQPRLPIVSPQVRTPPAPPPQVATALPRTTPEVRLPIPPPRDIGGMQNQTAFGGLQGGGATRQFSARGHESLASARIATPGPSAAAPRAGASPAGGATRSPGPPARGGGRR